MPFVINTKFAEIQRESHVMFSRNPFAFLIEHANPFFHHFFYTVESETAEKKPLYDK